MTDSKSVALESKYASGPSVSDAQIKGKLAYYVKQRKSERKRDSRQQSTVSNSPKPRKLVAARPLIVATRSLAQAISLDVLIHRLVPFLDLHDFLALCSSSRFMRHSLGRSEGAWQVLGERDQRVLV